VIRRANEEPALGIEPRTARYQVEGESGSFWLNRNGTEENRGSDRPRAAELTPNSGTQTEFRSKAGILTRATRLAAAVWKAVRGVVGNARRVIRRSSRGSDPEIEESGERAYFDICAARDEANRAAIPPTSPRIRHRHRDSTVSRAGRLSVREQLRIARWTI